MNKTPNSLQKVMLRRKVSVASIVVATFLFLVFINVESAYILHRMGALLQDSLSERLRSTALLSAELLERDLTSFDDPYESGLARITLAHIRTEHPLEAAYIIDSDRKVLLDSRPELEWQTLRSYLTQDSMLISRALEQGNAVSPLYSIQGNYFKNVYQRLIPLQGEPVILVLEGNAGFFRSMEQFRGALIIAAITSGILYLFLTGFLIIATSRFLRTERQLEQSKRLASLGQMAATVAHEIRNPLGIIKSSSDILKKKSVPAEHNELIQFIDDEVQRINRLINDFLALSKQPKLSITKQNLSEQLESLVYSLKQAHPHIEFKTKIAPDLVVYYDQDRLQQVLLNILQNSIQALEGKFEKIEISAHLFRAKRKLFIAIKIADNGPGISTHPEQIFEPFYTTKARGTGLGLAVSKRIIESHHGFIRVSNQKPTGLLVELEIPANREEKR
jgi:signal transduction histidine kinase